MAYAEKTVIAGDVIEKYKYHCSRYPGQKLPRRQNREKTQLPQWKVNERNAIRKLYWLILNNFKEEDIRMDLTYAGDEPDEKRAYKDLTNYIARLKRLYRKHGQELKWIAVTECRGHRVHHHVLINNIGLTRKDLAPVWPFANISYKAFRYYDGGYEDAKRVAAYFVKETRETYCLADAAQKQRWRASRNLKPPTIITKVMQSKSWREKPRPVKGYYVADVTNGWRDDGYPFQSYRLIREEADERTLRQKEKQRNVHHQERKTGLRRHTSRPV